MAIGNVGKLSDSSFYDSNTLYVVGEVINTGDAAIQNTNVKVIFYDSSDQKITTIEGHTDLNVILAGRKSFFNIRLLESEGSLNVNSYTIWFNWTDSTLGKPLGLVVLSSSDSVDAQGHKHVTGQIQNQGSVDSINTEVSATFYNSSGTVIGTAWTFANPSSLSPNQIGTFDIELIYTQQVTKVASYSLTAESYSLAFSPTSLLDPSPSPSPSQTTNTSPSSSPTTSTSASSFPTPTASLNPSTTPQNTQQTTSSPSVSNASPNPSTSTETSTTLIAIIAGSVIIVLVAIFIFYWTKRRKLPIKP